jgi:YD repeat-containing protein
MTCDFTFDYENRLTQVKQGTDVIATFTYDAEGRSNPNLLT